MLPRARRKKDTLITRYRKSVAALVGAVATWGLTAGADDKYTQVEIWGLVAAVGTVVSVWGVKNTPPKGESRAPDVSEAAV